MYPGSHDMYVQTCLNRVHSFFVTSNNSVSPFLGYKAQHFKLFLNVLLVFLSAVHRRKLFHT